MNIEEVREAYNEALKSMHSVFNSVKIKKSGNKSTRHTFELFQPSNKGTVSSPPKMMFRQQEIEEREQEREERARLEEEDEKRRKRQSREVDKELDALEREIAQAEKVRREANKRRREQEQEEERHQRRRQEQVEQTMDERQAMRQQQEKQRERFRRAEERRDQEQVVRKAKDYSKKISKWVIEQMTTNTRIDHEGKLVWKKTVGRKFVPFNKVFRLELRQGVPIINEHFKRMLNRLNDCLNEWFNMNATGRMQQRTRQAYLLLGKPFRRRPEVTRHDIMNIEGVREAYNEALKSMNSVFNSVKRKKSGNKSTRAHVELFQPSWEKGNGPIEYHNNPPTDLVGDQEVLVDRFFVDATACVNDNTADPRPSSQPGEARQRYGKPVPDVEKIKTWANVLNLHQYGYQTEQFAEPLIRENQQDMVRYEDIRSPKESGVFRIVSYNVHAFLNSFSCIVAAPQAKGRSVVSGHDVAAFMASFVRPDVICLQEFTGLPWGPELRLHGFKHMFDAVSPVPIGTALVTQGEADMPNFLGVATFAVGGTPMCRPVVGRAKRSKINPPYDEPFRPFLCATVTMHGLEVELWNIHPEAVSFSKEDNERQLRGLFQDLATKTHPVLVMGDYNCENVEPFLAGSFRLHPGAWLHGADRPVYTSWAGSYIDHVCTNAAFRSAFSLEVKVLPADLSDHFPVQVDVRLSP